jgi:hypothetical protein
MRENLGARFARYPCRTVLPASRGRGWVLGANLGQAGAVATACRGREHLLLCGSLPILGTMCDPARSPARVNLSPTGREPGAPRPS